MEGGATVRLAWELPALGGPVRVAGRELPRVRTIGLRDDSTQAVSKRRLARSVSTTTAVACLHATLYSLLFRLSIIASSRGSAWLFTHAAANASSPSASRAAATVRSCSAHLAGGRGQPI